MRKPLLSFSVLFFLLVLSVYVNPSYSALPVQEISQDEYLLRNGRIWKNLYAGVKGTPYFLSNEYLQGNITFNGKVFQDRTFKYDIFNDEVVLWINVSTVINLNKEMVDEFEISYLNTRYHIVNMGSDSANIISGYVNVYYEGPTSLYVKYRKDIEILAVDNKYDLFVQMHRIYINKDGQIIQVSGKKALLKLLADRKTELRNYIKQNKLRLEKSEPLTFVPLLEFYDNLRK